MRRSSAGAISRLCATFTLCSLPSRLRTQKSKMRQAREARMHIVFLPDKTLQQERIVRQAIEDLRSC